MAVRHQEGGHVHNGRTTRTDVPTTSGAGRPLGTTEEDERRAAKKAAVAAYVRAANAALLPVDRTARGMVAQQTGKLLDQGWDLPAILRAVDRFGRKRRMAGHLAEWVRENAMDEREKEHETRKESDRRTASSSMRGLAKALKEAGL